MDGLGRLLRKPFQHTIKVALRGRQQDVNMRFLDCHRGDRPIGFRLALPQHFFDYGSHFRIETNRFPEQQLFGHALADRVASVELMMLDVADLLIPGAGPVAPLVTG